MTSKGTVTKQFKRGNQNNDTITPKNRQKRIFRYFIKDKLELSDENLKKQRVKRSHVKKYNLNRTERTEELNKKLEVLEKTLKPKNKITTLNLHQCKLDDINPNNLTKINKNLKRQPSFSRFIYQLSEEPNPCEDQDLHRIYQLTKGLKYLTKFCLHVGFMRHLFHNITDEGLRSLAKALKEKRSLKVIQVIQLFFQYCSEITDEGRQEICKVLQKLITLKSIKLDFVNCKKMAEEGTQTLRVFLERLRYLQSIHLNFIECYETPSQEQQVNQVAEDRKIPSLSSLRELSLKSRGLADIEIERLNQVLKVATSLQDLHFDVHNHGIELYEARILQLNEALGGLNNLKKLIYYFHSSIYPKKGLRNLAENLEKLKDLKEISLRFPPSRNITDKKLKALGQSLKKLTFLENVALSFPSSPSSLHSGNITNAGVDQIIQVLPQLLSLKKLDLSFQSFKKITDISLQSLSKCLKNLKLQGLSLDFSGCALKNKSLQSLSECLKNPELRDLSLNFSGCNLTNQGMEWVTEILKQLKSLRYVGLIFSGCTSIKNSGVNSIAEGLKSLTHIEKIVMSFSSCYITKSNLKKVQKDLFEKFPTRDITVSEGDFFGI